MKHHTSSALPYLKPGPWALHEPELQRLPANVAGRLATIQGMTAVDMHARVQAVSGHVLGRVSGPIAVIPIRGIITGRYDWFTWLMDGTSMDMVRAAVRQYLADPSLSAIVFDIDSPGGYLEGLQDTFDELFAARGQKTMVAIANRLSASAAYWPVTACDEFWMTQDAQVGSVGVFTEHWDASKFYEAMGVHVTVVKYGEHKAETHDVQPLSEEAEAELQASVNYFGDMFVKAVAKGRGTSVAEVKADFGQGRVLRAKDAVRVGMVDRIGTLEQLLAKLTPKHGRGGLAAAASTPEPPAVPVAAGDPAPPPEPTATVLAAEESPVEAQIDDIDLLRDQMDLNQRS